MDASIVDKDLIERINKGEEKAFEVLYNSYFVYLCACANSYIFNPVEAQDIVNETFAKIWYRRGELSFPIHAYLIRAIQNGCLNYLRSLHSRERIIDEYREALLEYHICFCFLAKYFITTHLIGMNRRTSIVILKSMINNPIMPPVMLNACVITKKTLLSATDVIWLISVLILFKVSA